MKKITFIITMLLFSITSYSQIDTTTVVETETITTAERVIDKYSGKAYEAVKELATALKVPAEHVYTILVKQALVESITWLIVMILGISMITGGVIILKGPNAMNESKSDITGTGAIGIVGTIVGGFITIVSLFYIDVIVMGFVNPEYYAIKQIVEILTS